MNSGRDAVPGVDLPGLDRGITRGNCLLQGRRGLAVEITVSWDFMKTQLYALDRSTGRLHSRVPDDVFTERQERLFLVVSKHLKHNRLRLDVVNEGFSHLNSNLSKTTEEC